jgi:hypothetical protein
MRWNCPHCEELVTAGIDFANTKKAYVRCRKCNGMAIVHRSAALADYVKARRMEEENQIAAEEHEASVRQESIPSVDRDMDLGSDLDSYLPVMEMTSATTAQTAPSNSSLETVTAAATAPTKIAALSMIPTPPAFPYAKPPAFLLRESPSAIETIVRSFETETEEEIIGIQPERRTQNLSPTKNSTIALWIAAGLALFSGIYLYSEGRKAFAPAVRPAPAALSTTASR